MNLLADWCLVTGFLHFIKLQAVQRSPLSTILYQQRQCDLMAPFSHLFFPLDSLSYHLFAPNYSIAAAQIIVFLDGQRVKI